MLIIRLLDSTHNRAGFIPLQDNSLSQFLPLKTLLIGLEASL